MKLAEVPIGKLKPSPYNPRHMAEAELEALARSMHEFGIVDPLVVNKDGTVIGGHQRLKAAQLAGIETVPVVYVDLTKAQEKTLNLALNRIGGEWDEARLRVLLDDIADCDVDLALTGFSADELAWLDDRGEPWTMDDVLEELEMTDAVAKPLWVVIRAPQERAAEIDAALAALDLPDVSVERSA